MFGYAKKHWAIWPQACSTTIWQLLKSYTYVFWALWSVGVWRPHCITIVETFTNFVALQIPYNSVQIVSINCSFCTKVEVWIISKVAICYHSVLQHTLPTFKKRPISFCGSGWSSQLGQYMQLQHLKVQLASYIRPHVCGGGEESWKAEHDLPL
jgi:hypothetical protein